jgi:hypothetical protein
VEVDRDPKVQETTVIASKRSVPIIDEPGSALVITGISS